MQQFLLLIVLATANAAYVKNHKTHEEPKCHLAVTKINNYYYIKDLPTNLTGIPSDISVHWRTNRIFFTLISDDYLKMKLQVLKNGILDTIKIPGIGQSSTVDNRNDVVYLASDNGVYTYKDDGATTLYAASGEDVMYLATSNDGRNLFIATWPQNRVHIITNNGKKQETFPLIPNGHDLTVDTRNNIYFVASKTLYILQAQHNIPIKIKGLPTDRMTGVFVSRSGKVYGMDEVGKLYIIDSNNEKATLIGAFDVHGVNAFGMDSYDNVMIGVKGAIFKFHKVDSPPCPEFEETK